MIHIDCCRRILFVCLLIVLTVTGCKPKQKILFPASTVEDKANHELFTDIIDRELSYHTLSAKLNMGVTSGTKVYSSKANLKIVKNEALQISVQPLFGVELFRVQMNPDTIFVLDRMNKRYVLEAFDTLKEVYPVGFDYYTIQSLLTNAIFVSGKDTINQDDYNIFTYHRNSTQNYQIASTDVVSGIDYTFTVNGDDRITFTHLMQPEKKQFIQWEYNDFMMVNSRVFPHKMNLTLSSSSKLFNAELEFSNVLTDEPFQLALNVPSNYKKTSIEDVLKILFTKK